MAAQHLDGSRLEKELGITPVTQGSGGVENMFAEKWPAHELLLQWQAEWQVELQAREQGDLSEKIQGELLKVRTPPQARCISIYKVSFTPILGLF
jgi:hypothetical protein